MEQIHKLTELVKQLRDKEKGCPWDLEQDFSSIAPHTLEEAYEVVDAIETKDMQGLREELGDLLFQVVFHAQMADEQGLFNFDDVVESVYNKMVSRHPHIFGNEKISSAKEQSIAWEKYKKEEKMLKNQSKFFPEDVLDGVPIALPAMSRALKLQKKAAKVGFDWNHIKFVFDKLDEEIVELNNVLDVNGSKNDELEEIGDIIFCCVNIARKLEIDPEEALRFCNRKFESRFKYIQQQLDLNCVSIENSSFQELNELWDQAKIAESELKLK